MKIYLKILFLGLVFLPVSAFAVTMTEDVTLSLSGDSFTLGSISTFDSFTVNNSDFTFSLSDAQSIRITSADKRNFAVTPSGDSSVTCGTGSSVLNLSVVSGAPTTAYIIAPSGTCGGTSASSGTSLGGGIIYGDGGLFAPQLMPTQPSAQSTSSPANQNISIIFSQTLSKGSTGSDVTKLQTFLASDKSIYPKGLVTGYFGALTAKAVELFQARYGLSQTGIADLETRGKLNELYASGLSTETAPGSQITLIVNTLRKGMAGEAVRILQQFLAKDKQIYPDGLVTGYFGSLTEAAVKRFQTMNGIEVIGIVGPKTRAKINQVLSQ